jgi:hypothetical protein
MEVMTYRIRNKRFCQTISFVCSTIFIIGISCKGQAQNILPKDKLVDSSVISMGQLKLKKTLDVLQQKTV